jgi:hypothetical protein
MNRCVSLSLSLTLAALAATNASAQNAQTLGPVESPQATQAAQANQAAQAAALAAAQSAQQASTDGQSLQRHFPQKALRGKIVFGTPPFVRLDGNVMQMAAAYRVHGFNNLLLMSGQLVGVEGVVDYTVDLNGQPYEIWLLTPAEAANKPWPRTTAEAAAWTFDPIAQTWTKP